MEDLRSLDQFPAGAKVRILKFRKGAKARCRLCALGLTPGTVVEINSPGPGPCRLTVRDSCLVLGQGLAGSVLGSIASGNGGGPKRPIGQYCFECEELKKG